MRNFRRVIVRNLRSVKVRNLMSVKESYWAHFKIKMLHSTLFGNFTEVFIKSTWPRYL